MTKSDLIKTLKAAGIKDASAAVDTVFDTIAETLAAGEDVRISGFGTFAIKEYEAREAHNPATGEKIMVEARRKVGFKPGKGLKEKVNGATV